jgi:hypothetical protein
MKKKYIIGICSVGSKYHEKTIKLIRQINSIIDINFLILTDEAKKFEEFNNIYIEPYKYKSTKYLDRIFSFHDKRIIFEKGFEYSDTVLLLDADHCVREDLKQNLIDFDSDKISTGAYPQITWKHPSSCSIENFLDGLTNRVPYGIEFKQYSISKNYKLQNSLLIQESFLIIKEDREKVSNFLEIWSDLQSFCENRDIGRQQHVLGYGEGYSIGVSLNTANINIIEGNSDIGKLASSFKHFAWEKD